LIQKVISGGQTGVDRAALDAAIDHGIPVGGSCPKGRRAEDGPIPSHYTLQEMPTTDYLPRTLQNVLDSDGTLVLCFGPPAGGTASTIERAIEHRKPFLAVDLRHPEVRDVPQVIEWLQSEGIRTLNVAGPRGSKEPRVYPEACAFLRRVFGSV
jgi:hypothetical protein